MQVHSAGVDKLSGFQGRMPLAVFDIGGTWFRRGVWMPDAGLVDTSRAAAINYCNTPNQNVHALQQALIDYLVTEVDAARQAYPSIDTAAISLGAALNGHTGEVLQASPLWGSATGPFPILQMLQNVRRDVRWVLVNDVTAALLRHVWATRAELTTVGCPKAALFTISTGIAARTFDFTRWAVPLDRRHGVQGEVGHLAIDFRFRDVAFNANCDCGGPNHVNAFSSGRGITRLTRDVATAFPTDFKASQLAGAAAGLPSQLEFADLAAAIDANDVFANEILDAACGPIADLIIQLLTYDPEVERVFMVGGVVGRLGDRYMTSLHAALNSRGMYQVTGRDASFFEDRVVQGQCDDQSGMIGAGIYASTCRTDEPPAPGTTSPQRQSSRLVSAARRVQYSVDFVPRLLDPSNDALMTAARTTPQCRRLVVMDAGAALHYGKAIGSYFGERGIKADLISIATSEGSKTLEGVTGLLRTFANYGLLRRSEPVIAIGGGILTDMVGFAASIYRRGTPYVRVPTTLMGMVDAGIGAKTGVTFGGKNRLGSYHPPIQTLIDIAFLQTLDRRHLRCGIAEIIKIALVRDADLFAMLETHGLALLAQRFQDGDGKSAVAAEVCFRAVHGMLDELEPNLFEDDLQRRVDFGHSFSPGIEVVSNFRVLHGEAVAIDMILSAAVSLSRGLIDISIFDRIANLLKTIGLSLRHSSANIEVLAGALYATQQHRDGHQRVPLLNGIGSVVFADDVTADELRGALGRVDATARLAAARPAEAAKDEVPSMTDRDEVLR